MTDDWTDPVDGVERVDWTQVLLAEDPPGPWRVAMPGQTGQAASAQRPPGQPDPNALQLRVRPPHTAKPEMISLKPDLSDASAVLPRVVANGYFIHGEGYFDAIRAAVRGANQADPDNQVPLRTMTQTQLSQLTGIVDDSIRQERVKIAKAEGEVQVQAVGLALARLETSLADTLAATIRYVKEASDERRAKAWLRHSFIEGGQDAVVWNESALELVQSLLVLRGYFQLLITRAQGLAKAMRASSQEMEAIAGRRWTYLNGKDPKNTARANDRIESDDYGVELMNASNPARPDLVAEAERLFPEPARVTSARAAKLEAAAALTSTLIDEADGKSVLYRIWSPGLADTIYREVRASDSRQATIKILDHVSEFRRSVADALRSAYSAANALHGKIKGDGSLVWKYPLLIGAAVEAMALGQDDYRRVVAEHRLVATAEAAERVQMVFARTSEVLLAAQLAVRFVPAPEVSVPAAIILGIVDSIVGGIGLLYQYFLESEARDAFRAFLSPADCFAASDGSYVGLVVGAAFLVFGTLGLKRSSLTVPSKAEIGMAVGGVGLQEYLGARGKPP